MKDEVFDLVFVLHLQNRPTRGFDSESNALIPQRLKLPPAAGHMRNGSDALEHMAEPILQRIKEDRTRVVSPSFDNIKYDTFEIEEYPLSAQGFDWELWCRYLNPPKSWWTQRNQTAPIRSPALIGCFVVDRKYFEEIGLLDEGMEIYGGENVELGIRHAVLHVCTVWCVSCEAAVTVRTEMS
ncbi:unnamed protein product [Pleuronectes platessa]|uniref:Uncharacterized protein n=1 Tax=Pleuronectes platessa TaxID=8262 RepID=A0A9N7TWK9_PLEPL|nr:unnamed protein product [Pleuronectes platessa]